MSLYADTNTKCPPNISPTNASPPNVSPPNELKCVYRPRAYNLSVRFFPFHGYVSTALEYGQPLSKCCIYKNNIYCSAYVLLIILSRISCSKSSTSSIKHGTLLITILNLTAQPQIRGS